jgi:AcrR family transcriptional regulator
LINGRKRRTAAEVRHDILAAAQEVFAEKGYAAASTREIAKRAEVAGPLIFRHYENKAKLFAAAVFEPIEQMLDDNVARSDILYPESLSPIERLRNYAEVTIGAFRQNKRLLIAYMNALAFHAEEFDAVHGASLVPPSFEDRIAELERQRLQHPLGASYLMSDHHYETRLILLLFYSVALFDDLFFDPIERGSEREMRSIVKLISMGTGLTMASELPADIPPTAPADATALAEENRVLRELLVNAMVDLNTLRK